MLVEHLGAEQVRRHAGQAVVAPARIAVEEEVAVGVGEVEPEAVLLREDRLEERDAEPGLDALMHGAVCVHDGAETERRRPQALQLVPDLGAVEREVPRDVGPAAAGSDLVGGRGLGIDARSWPAT